MRTVVSTVLLGLMLLVPARGAMAQEEGALAIPLPSNSKVMFEVDASEEDLLGVLKSLLKGFNGQSLMGMMNMIPGMMGGGGMPGVPGAEGAPGGAAAGVGQMLSQVDLGATLGTIRRVHMVVFTPAAGSKPEDLIQFYEERFRAGGGRRLVWMDMGDMKMMMMGFGSQGGWAAVMPMGADGVVVMRADGYPNLEGVGPIMMMAIPALSMFGSIGKAMGAGDAATVEPESSKSPPTITKPAPAKRPTPPRPTRPRTPVRRR